MPRKQHIADRIIRAVKSNKYIQLFIAVAGALALLATFKDSIISLASLVHLRLEASNNAEEILAIKNEVERQRDSIALVVRDANTVQEKLNDAKRLYGEALTSVTSLKELVVTAQKQVADIKSVSDFSFLALKAQNDDRKSFDSLRDIANDTSNPFHDMALLAAVQIASNDDVFSYSIDWHRLGLREADLTLDDYSRVLEGVKPIERSGVLESLWNQERFSKFARLQFLISVRVFPRLDGLNLYNMMIYSEKQIFERNACF